MMRYHSEGQLKGVTEDGGGSVSDMCTVLHSNVPRDGAVKVRMRRWRPVAVAKRGSCVAASRVAASFHPT